MKKYIYSLVAALMAMTSCNNNDLVPETDGTTQQVILQVAPDQGLNTRATDGSVNNFLIEVYTNDAYSEAANVFTGNTNKATSTDGSFTMVLDKTKDYYCLLWADKSGSTVYTTTNLKEVALINDQTPVEAWQGKLKIEKGTTATLSVTLKRAVAKITLLETGVLKAGTLTMTFDQSTKFDVSAGTTSTTAQRTETITVAAIEQAVLAGSKINTNDIFVLASTTDAEQPTITFQITGEAESTQVSNVPLKANYNTNIKGHYSKNNSNDATFTLTCDDAWSGDKTGTVAQ